MRWQSQQHGLERYNCADSLDRTNAASYFGAVQVSVLVFTVLVSITACLLHQSSFQSITVCRRALENMQRNKAQHVDLHGAFRL